VRARIAFLTALAVFGVLAVFIFVAWTSGGSSLSLQEPGADRPGYGGADSAADAGLAIGKDFTFFKPLNSTLPGFWPGFRGPGRDNIAAGDGPLSDLSDFTQNRILWSVNALGEGHGGAAVADGRVYLLDYDEDRKEEALRCLSLADGTELWRRSYPARMKRNHGYSRTVPAVWDRFAVTIGPLCDLMCVDRLSGDLVWTLDLTKEFGAEIPPWYSGQCPFIWEGRLILNVGGSILVACLDVATGEVLWTVPNPDGAHMTHASVSRISFGGESIFLCAFSTGLYGIIPPRNGGKQHPAGAEAPREGRISFRVPQWTVQVEVPTPIALADGGIYLTAGYGAGNMLVGLSASGGGIHAGVLARNPPGIGLSSEQQTPVLFDGFLYGIQTADSGELHDQLVCAKPDGTIVWASGKDARFGLGPYLLADGKLYILTERGTLIVVEATPEGYNEISRNHVLDAVDAWGPMAIAGTRLLLRDSRRLICMDLEERI
jgi:outer membrane protein assembly factor BamB